MTTNISTIAGIGVLQNPTLFWFADLYFKSTIILAAVFCLQLVFRRWSACKHSSLWKLTFVVLALLPILKLLFPNLAFALELDQELYVSSMRFLESELARLAVLAPLLTDSSIKTLGVVYLSASLLLSVYLFCGLLQTWLITRTAIPIDSSLMDSQVQNLKDINGSGST